MATLLTLHCFTIFHTILVLALVFFTITPTAAQSSRCPTLSSHRLAELQSLTGEQLFGCRISLSQCRQALSRINWIVPRDTESPLFFVSRPSGIRRTLISSGVPRRTSSTIARDLRILRRANARPGALRINPDCLGVVPSDRLQWLLSTSRTALGFNNRLRRICERRGLITSIGVTGRALDTDGASNLHMRTRGVTVRQGDVTEIPKATRRILANTAVTTLEAVDTPSHISAIRDQVAALINVVDGIFHR